MNYNETTSRHHWNDALGEVFVSTGGSKLQTNLRSPTQKRGFSLKVHNKSIWHSTGGRLFA